MDGVADADELQPGLGRVVARRGAPSLAVRFEPDRTCGVEAPAAGPRICRLAASEQRRGRHRPGLGRDRGRLRPAIGRPDPGQDVGPGLAREDDGLADQPAQEPQVRHDTEDERPVESLGETFEGRRAIRTPGDDLGQHRIEPPADLAAELDPGIDPDAVAGRPAEGVDPAGRGQEAVVGVLGVEADLDGVAAWRVGAVAEWLPRGDVELVGDEVAAGHELGDRVLDLETRVHLEEREPSAAVEQELAGPRADIADRSGECQRRLAEPSAESLVHRRRRRLLEDLLVPALDRAVPLAERDAVAVLVEQDLDLDVTCPDHEALEDQPVVAEGCGGFPPGGRDGVRQGLGAADRAHPLAAATGRRLDQQREPDPRRRRRGGRRPTGPGRRSRRGPARRARPRAAGPRPCRPSSGWRRVADRPSGSRPR